MRIFDCDPDDRPPMWRTAAFIAWTALCLTVEALVFLGFMGAMSVAAVILASL
jgi:hypothetical protein